MQQQLVKHKIAIVFLLVTGISLLTSIAFGQTATTIGSMASTVTSSFASIGKLFIAAAYIAGFALTVAAIFKFKAHKENPQQAPLGTAIALLVIGVLLVFIPAIFGPAGSSIFGAGAQTGGFEGSGASTIHTDNNG